MIPKQTKFGNSPYRGVRVNLPQMREEWDVSLPIKLTNSKLKGIFHFHNLHDKKVYSNIPGINPRYLKGLTYTNKNVLLSIIIINFRKSEALRFKVRMSFAPENRLPGIWGVQETPHQLPREGLDARCCRHGTGAGRHCPSLALTRDRVKDTPGGCFCLKSCAFRAKNRDRIADYTDELADKAQQK